MHVDGAWMRAFDYGKWEYWASDADWGYGPWVTDSGWTNGNVNLAMGARILDTNVWDIMSGEAAEWGGVEGGLAMDICEEMLLGHAEEYCV